MVYEHRKHSGELPIVGVNTFRMIAIYAPFIEPGASTQTLIGMGALGLVIDGTWYVSVAAVLSDTGAIDKLRARAHLIDGAMGLLMFFFAALLAMDVL